MIEFGRFLGILIIPKSIKFQKLFFKMTFKAMIVSFDGSDHRTRLQIV